MLRKLPPESLSWQFEDMSIIKQALKHKRTGKQDRIGVMAQERAHDALELGLGIKQRGYNIFVVGASGTGRTSTVNQLLHDRAQKEPTPDDIILLYNFDNRDRPLAVPVPPSFGPKIKKTYDTLVERMLTDLEKTFESERYVEERQEVQELCRVKTDAILSVIDEKAKAEGFVLQRGAGALTLTPANSGGEAITETEFEKLTDDQKVLLEQGAEKLESNLEDAIRKVRAIERETEENIEKLERKTADAILLPLFDNAKSQWKNLKTIVTHLDAMREDILNRLRHLIPDDHVQPIDGSEQNQSRRRLYEEDEEPDYDEPTLIRYRVNPLVTRSKSAGAPVVQETHPTSSNLIGRIEQRIRAGETLTDHTRIRAGALYHANGGYLVIEAQDILRDPSAWEGLKRALKNRAVELDDPGEPGRMISVVALRPEPVDLSLKVVLIGVPELYYALSKNDPDFGKLFKVKADFDIEMELSANRIEQYIKFLGGVCEEENLRKLQYDGAARVLEQAVRLSGNQKKLTTRIGDIADLVREANFWANKYHAKFINKNHVKRALDARAEREGFLEIQMLEDILENRVFIETDGEVAGQINALTVIELGSYEFGVPIRITCTVGCGRGQIIDIERETKQGGPIHTKGRLIISGLMAGQFGKDIPLGFNANLCMEQTYSDIDGDSASLAETCALLSILANAPISQRFAITGSIDQRGQIQAVGGINEKIEGFFKLCQARNSTLEHGVLIPFSNAANIVLKEEVIAAHKEGKFTIYTVNTFHDAIELLTGRSWDKGKNSLKSSIMDTLKRFHKIRSNK
ncbi:MAG: AAA family ATPase [bacterium]|nr:AAA family ATPase [bacterium]